MPERFIESVEEYPVFQLTDPHERFGFLGGNVEVPDELIERYKRAMVEWTEVQSQIRLLGISAGLQLPA